MRQPARMRTYRRVLRAADFRRLWLGATASAIGDGMTFVALSWLVLTGGGATRLGLLAVCYTAPVIVGGLLTGPILDRFDKRAVLVADSVFRAALMATIPITAAFQATPTFLPFVAAAGYGLLKMVPLAGFPAAIPALVAESDLDAANALESLSFSVAGVIGPALSGVLIPIIGAPNVLAIDSATFLIFAITTARVRQPLRAATPVHQPPPPLRTLLNDRVIVLTTVAFMAFNVAEGMLLVTAPWLAKTRPTGGATTLGVLLSLTAIGEIIGATTAARRNPTTTRPTATTDNTAATRTTATTQTAATTRDPATTRTAAQNAATTANPATALTTITAFTTVTTRTTAAIRAIATAQLLAAAAYLTVLAPGTVALATGFLLIGLFSAPMTVWAQSLRMRRIPAPLHGRAFALLRTLMQGTLPLGSLLVTPFLATGSVGQAAITMTLIGGLPALTLLLRRSTPGRAAAQSRPSPETPN